MARLRLVSIPHLLAAAGVLGLAVVGSALTGHFGLALGLPLGRSVGAGVGLGM